MLSLQGALDYVYVLRSIGDPDEIFLQGILDNACVQAAEREYCTVANVLAGKLLEEADKRSSALAVLAEQELHSDGVRGWSSPYFEFLFGGKSKRERARRAMLWRA
eukprot:scaffold270032_cov17-Tisochrysis_lutea.AAC.1